MSKTSAEGVLYRRYTDSDGDCVCRLKSGKCAALNEKEPGCGTYECKFYKPKDCKDYIRLDKPPVMLIPPECYPGEWIYLDKKHMTIIFTEGSEESE